MVLGRPGAGEANELQELDSCPGERVAGGGREEARRGGTEGDRAPPFLALQEPWLLPLFTLQATKQLSFLRSPALAGSLQFSCTWGSGGAAGSCCSLVLLSN